LTQEKIKVAIVFGGRSTEHEISILSAQNVYKSLDKNKFEAVLIGIDKKGQWHYNETAVQLLNNEQNKPISAMSHPVILSQNTSDGSLVSQTSHKIIAQIDVIFPVLHGTFGEDGSIQGLAKLANIPIVGCGILGSAVGMDKDIMKRILRDANIPVARWLCVRPSNKDIQYDDVAAELGSELFIKPANLGSSVGVAFAKNKTAFDEGLREALKYDSKVIIEEKVVGRELECAVLGNYDPIASIPGEVEPTKGFYSYESKYLDEKGAILHIPAILSEEEVSRIQSLSIEVFKLLECRGMSRVDMFMKPDGQLIINEINTIPGFTNISMYPKLWELSGIPQAELIKRLILLAIEEHQINNNLKL
jgi:D-alanine-D-alanine ligase